MIPSNDQTFYDVLEVSPNATREDILRAYHRAKSAYSANSPALYSVFSKEEAEELLKLIDEAYSVLIHQDRRREYDSMLLQKKKGATSRPAADAREPDLMVIDGGHPSELPDFVIPEAEAMPIGNEEMARSRARDGVAQPVDRMSKPEPQQLKNSQEPAMGAPSNSGGGKTRFSHYDIDVQMEQEIAAQSVFDGTFLQRVRKYKRISLEQISDHSRVGRHYLIALENNDFKLLPAPVFVRGFVSQFARVLGLDEKKVVESYMKLLKDSSGR